MNCTVRLVVLIWLAIASDASAMATVCPAPGAFIEGRIDSRWVGVLLDFKGEYGGPHAATVYTTTWTLEGVLLTKLGSVKAHGERAVALHALFAHDELYVINDSYVSRSTKHHDEYFAFAIQRFSIRDGKLIPEAEGIFKPSLLPGYQLVARGTDGDNCDTSRLDTSLKKAIDAGTLNQIWTPATNPTR